MDVIVAVDGGKTKFAVGLFTTSLELIETERVSAADPAACVAAVADRVAEASRRHAVSAVGLSVFGPLETDPARADYGAIVGASVPAWSGVNVAARLHRASGGRPVRFDFDVAAGAAAEARLGAARGLADFVYLSVGTGIGAAVYSGGRRVVGIDSPQVGHAFVPREDGDTFAGSCRFHRDCLQGLASGTAMTARWGVSPVNLPAGYPAWDLEARYLARACVNLIYTVSPARVLLGSGVSQGPGLADAVNRHVAAYLGGFPTSLVQRFSASDRPVELAALSPQSSLWGAALLASEGAGLPFPRP